MEEQTQQAQVDNEASQDEQQPVEQPAQAETPAAPQGADPSVTDGSTGFYENHLNDVKSE